MQLTAIKLTILYSHNILVIHQRHNYLYADVQATIIYLDGNCNLMETLWDEYMVFLINRRHSYLRQEG
jgi:hypothetical protein